MNCANLVREQKDKETPEKKEKKRGNRPGFHFFFFFYMTGIIDNLDPGQGRLIWWDGGT